MATSTSSAELTVCEFVSEASLPATVRLLDSIDQGVGCETLEAGREVTLLYVEDDVMVRLEDTSGHDFHERASLEACRFRLLPKSPSLDNRTFATVRDTLESKPLPEFVRAQSGYCLDEVDIDDVIEPGDVFEVGTGSCFKNGIECAVWFRLVSRAAAGSSADELSTADRKRSARSTKAHHREPITMPMNADGDFHTTIDESKYFLREIVSMVRSKRLHLPARVCVVEEEGTEGTRLPDKQLGRKLTIAELPTRRSVVATDGTTLFRIAQSLCDNLRVEAVDCAGLSSDNCVRTMASFIDSNRLRTAGPPEPASISSQLLPPISQPTSSPVKPMTSAITSPVRLLSVRHNTAYSARPSPRHELLRGAPRASTLPSKARQIRLGNGSAPASPAHYSPAIPWKTGRSTYEDVDLEPTYCYSNLKDGDSDGRYSGDSGVQVCEKFDELNYAVMPETSHRTSTTNHNHYTSTPGARSHDTVKLRSRSPPAKFHTEVKPFDFDDRRKSTSTPNLGWETYDIPRSTPLEDSEFGLSEAKPAMPVPKPRARKNSSRENSLRRCLSSNPSAVSLPSVTTMELQKQINVLTKELDSCRWELNEAKFEAERLRQELSLQKAKCQCSNSRRTHVYTNYEYHVPRPRPNTQSVYESC